MDNNKNTADFDRKLSTASRENCLIVTQRGTCIPNPIRKASPVIQDIAVTSPTPMQRQFFGPVVEKPKSRPVHMEDLIADVVEKPKKVASQNVATTNKAVNSLNNSAQQIPREFQRSHPEVLLPIAKAQSEASKVQEDLQSVTEVAQSVAKTSPFIPLTNPVVDTAEKASVSKKDTKKAAKEEKRLAKIAKKDAKKAAIKEKALAKKAAKPVSKKSTKANKVEQAPSEFASAEAMASFLSPTPLATNSILKPSNITEKVLTSASKTSQEKSQSESQNSPMVDSSGAAAIVNPNNGILSRLSGTKITFSINISKKQVFVIFRTIIIMAIIATSGFLAWDTWVTNREAREMFSKPASAAPVNAVALIDEDLDTTSISKQEVAAHTVPADQPRFISIPALGINNARVLRVGINSNGNVDTPHNVNDTAWFDGSAKPGRNGAVFINAHTSFSRSFSGVFDRLPELNVGDRIIIERGDGEKFIYIVVEIETLPRDQVDMRRVLSAQGGSEQGLTLMTCSGTYDYRNGGASHRTMVYAVLK